MELKRMEVKLQDPMHTELKTEKTVPQAVDNIQTLLPENMNVAHIECQYKVDVSTGNGTDERLCPDEIGAEQD